MPYRLATRRDDRSIRVLLLESSADLAKLLVGELQQGGLTIISERVETEPAFTQALCQFLPDLILAAPTLERYDALSALKVLRAVRPTAPLIVVTDSLDEETAVGCLRAGAENLVLRSNLERLVPAALAAIWVRHPLKRLSPRQLEVLRLVSDGWTTREIAAQLRLSVKTVETHRGAVTQRLGIRDVASQVRYAVRVGLVPQNESRNEAA
jgi:DNA-binding NarL/FixJ family response regulator